MHPAVLQHFRAPHHFGPLDGADAVGSASNPACGDTVEVSLRLAGATISEARFRAQACAASIACASLLTDLVAGLSLAQAGALPAAALADGLGGLPEASAHAPALAIEALRAAVRRAGAAGGREPG